MNVVRKHRTVKSTKQRWCNGCFRRIDVGNLIKWSDFGPKHANCGQHRDKPLQWESP